MKRRDVGGQYNPENEGLNTKKKPTHFDEKRNDPLERRAGGMSKSQIYHLDRTSSIARNPAHDYHAPGFCRFPGLGLCFTLGPLCSGVAPSPSPSTLTVLVLRRLFELLGLVFALGP